MKVIRNSKAADKPMPIQVRHLMEIRLHQLQRRLPATLSGKEQHEIKYLEHQLATRPVEEAE